VIATRLLFSRILVASERFVLRQAVVDGSNLGRRLVAVAVVTLARGRARRVLARLVSVVRALRLVHYLHEVVALLLSQLLVVRWLGVRVSRMTGGLWRRGGPLSGLTLQFISSIVLPVGALGLDAVVTFHLTLRLRSLVLLEAIIKGAA
jgi:hypothetical protein